MIQRGLQRPVLLFWETKRKYLICYLQGRALTTAVHHFSSDSWFLQQQNKFSPLPTTPNCPFLYADTGHMPNSLHFSPISLTLLITIWETNPERLTGQHLLQSQECSLQKSYIWARISSYHTSQLTPIVKREEDQLRPRWVEYDGHWWGAAGGGGVCVAVRKVIRWLHWRSLCISMWPQTERTSGRIQPDALNFPQFTLWDSCKIRPIPR